MKVPSQVYSIIRDEELIKLGGDMLGTPPFIGLGIYTIGGLNIH